MLDPGHPPLRVVEVHRVSRVMSPEGTEGTERLANDLGTLQRSHRRSVKMGDQSINATAIHGEQNQVRTHCVTLNTLSGGVPCRVSGRANQVEHSVQNRVQIFTQLPWQMTGQGLKTPPKRIILPAYHPVIGILLNCDKMTARSPRASALARRIACRVGRRTESREGMYSFLEGFAELRPCERNSPSATEQ